MSVCRICTRELAVHDFAALRTCALAQDTRLADRAEQVYLRRESYEGLLERRKFLEMALAVTEGC